jgi:hypothetical protein
MGSSLFITSITLLFSCRLQLTLTFPQRPFFLQVKLGIPSHLQFAFLLEEGELYAYRDSTLLIFGTQFALSLFHELINMGRMSTSSSLQFCIA